MNFFSDIILEDIKPGYGLCNMTQDLFGLLVNKINLNEKNILIVTDSLSDASNLYNVIRGYSDKVNLFPMDDFLTSEALAISPDLKINRLETLNRISNSTGNIVITNLMGYLRFLPSKKIYNKCNFYLKVGDFINPKELVKKLISLGYVRDTIVNQIGEFAVRGFIIDAFLFGNEYPVRIEFFDDEIESIRFFDADNQRSIKSVDKIYFTPYTEFLSDKEVDSNHSTRQKYYPLYEIPFSISDYLDDSITFFKDYSQLINSYNKIKDEIDIYRNEKDSYFNGNYMFDFFDIKSDFTIYYFSFSNFDANINLSKMILFDVSTINNFNDDIDSINKFIYDSINNDMTVIIALKDYQLKSIIKHLNMKYVKTSLDNIILGEVNLVEQEFDTGFIYNNIVLLTAKNLFKYVERKKNYRSNYKYSTSIKEINNLKIGDYVVHNIHGIGIFNGIKTLTSNDVTKDYIEVLYQGSDKIYIPVEKIDLINKFSGRDGMVPKVNKLGGNEWKKVKARVRSKVVDIADKLIKLYAERESKKGFAFSPDCQMSIDFANDFPYELTVDQKKSIEQIKTDMESDKPMDRLLCGDVGFGKTEVAFQAAFKAILDSKQVLFLCPTTILSKQHYENAIIRFKNFPVSIGLLNRFTTKNEVLRIIDGLKNGTIDMVIGTHRLLGKDIVIKDLGLLIIDEEQRFGVTHKEKLKEYKTNVDVLTLSATPIPRTLQMSLVGIRSLSLIETPPVNRYPVQTYVLEENNQIIKDAINKELARGGQVYILYNRVQSILEFSYRIQNIVPDARIGIAHGQMQKNLLENTLYDFVNNRYDILICTTIIEIGMDISNVNTLIIIDADRFGLSQLYQIRGRVGRSDKFAYAYLMYQPFKNLTDTAIKRLNVIKEFTELGSGFSIAARDLSIRGAGDILGSEQAGFIDSVGIDLYLKILEEEINKKNNNEVSQEVENDGKTLINVTTHIDDSYIHDYDLKIEVHKLINTIEDKNSFERVKSELEDRFGKVSEDLIVYMYEEWFEKLANELNLNNVRQTKNSIELLFDKDFVDRINIDDLFIQAMNITRMFRFLSKGDNLIITLDIIKLDKHPIIYLVSLLDNIKVILKNTID